MLVISNGHKTLSTCSSNPGLFYFFGKGKCTEIFQVRRDIMPDVNRLIGKHFPVLVRILYVVCRNFALVRTLCCMSALGILK